MKAAIKRLLYAVAPRWTTAVQSARARAHSHRVVAAWGCGAVNHKLVERFGRRVLAGPFAGLELPPAADAEQLGPYLLGVYEGELDPAWGRVLRGDYPQVIDIGAKFGYYAVGLACRYPRAEVVAFDTDPWARRATRAAAAANGCGNVSVRGFCDPGWLLAHARAGALVVSDCEGYEAALFGPAVRPRLRTCTLLIETHDPLAPGVSGALRAGFADTHEVTVFGPDSHRRGPGVPLDFLSADERRLAEHEVRGPQEWLLCVPRST